jgi:hypothetical protein
MHRLAAPQQLHRRFSSVAAYSVSKTAQACRDAVLQLLGFEAEHQVMFSHSSTAWRTPDLADAGVYLGGRTLPEAPALGHNLS